MQRLCFFSSDAASLYKKDVFRILGLPKGYVIHFRYGYEHLDIDKGELNNLTGKPALILFSYGNNLKKPIEERTVTNVVLRTAKIQAVEEKKDTGLVHFYLLLEDFISCDLNINDLRTLPPHKWVKELETVNEDFKEWHEKIKEIKYEFLNQLFYKVELFSNARQLINPQFSEQEKQTFYELDDENNYLLDISFYDTTDIHNEKSQNLEISVENQNILKINAPKIVEIGARRDNRTFNLFTQSLTSTISFGYINFITTQANLLETLNNDITIAFQVKKNSSRSVKFAFYSILAIVGVAYVKLVSDKWDLYGSFSFSLATHSLAAIIIGFLASRNLYKHFNKR